VASLLQQDPGVPMHDYGFHSTSIIETLEKLQHEFHASKAQLNQQEEMAQHEHDTLIEEKRDFIGRSTHELEEAKRKQAKAVAHVQALNEQISTLSSQMLADQEFMATLANTCHDNAVTWDQRTKMRAAELATLTSAIAVVQGMVTENTTPGLVQKRADVSVAQVTASNADLMEAIEAGVEARDGAPSSFLQVAAAPRGHAAGFMQKRPKDTVRARDAVVDFLRGEGRSIKSLLLLRVASAVEADPFKKVEKLIQELIERLLAEAAAETNQKGWCDKAISDAEMKRDHGADRVAELNSEIATLEAERDELAEEMAVLSAEVSGLAAALAGAKKMREAEAAEHAKAIEDAKQGVVAVETAMDILSHFYKTAAKASVMGEPSMLQDPIDAAPSPGFEVFDAYQGSQGSAKGILGLMEVMRSDFKRTTQETEDEEADAQQHFSEFVLETNESIANKKTALGEKEDYLLDAKEQLSLAREKLDIQTGLLHKTISEIIQLQKPCVDTGMSYAQRVAMRQVEIDALKKAHCILDHMEEYNVDGTGSSCE